jgi:Domain of unknown function (DUF4184)
MYTVPFTLSHAAAALPFRRTRLIPSAVVVGTFAPDLEYFVRLVPGGHFGHTLPGVFISDLPVSLVVLWIFHAYMKEPIEALLPESMQRRLEPGPHTFRFWGPGRLALILASILVGVGTHILWDSFTHKSFWPYRHWNFLRHTMHLPILGWVKYYQLFQYVSSVGGIVVLLIWVGYWYRATAPVDQPPRRSLSSAKRLMVVVGLLLVATAGGLTRGFVKTGWPDSRRAFELFLGYVVVTALSVLWLQVLGWGIVWSRRKNRGRRAVDAS